jgi:TetR/AcrR family transcriptional regulator, transcriptional repressor for nem operon
MARPREFREERAVEAAMRAFWTAGYEATSTEDLCAATGLGRSSVYNTFRSKRELFERALRHYTTSRTAELVELMEADRPLREKVRTLLWQSVDPRPEDPAGCLVVNATVELAPHDDGVAELLRGDQERRLAALRAAIETGLGRGEIAGDKDPLALARFLVATVGGMRVMARGGADRAALESVASTALAAF